jgi:penicillin-binding protein 1A
LFYPRKIVSKRKIKEKEKEKIRKKKKFLIFLFSFLIIIIILITPIFFYYIEILSSLPRIEDIEYDPPQSSEIYDRDGNLIKVVFFSENRIFVSLDEVSKNFIDALIASEDERFFKHKGVDYKALIRATITNLKTKGISQGGSTITMQLARELFLSKEVTLERKIKEMILALRIEKLYSKEEILTYYINQVYFGSGAYGVEAAARRYFGKHAKDLTLSESAMLVGVLPSPSVYAPTINFEVAKERQKIVLERMVKNGYITEEEAKRAYEEEIVLKEYKEDIANDPNGWFIDYVKDRVREILGEEILYKGGLKIYTTIDQKIQNLAFTTFNKIIEDNVKAKIFSNKKDDLGVRQPQGAVVIIDPKSGEILAMVGGRDYSETQFNRTLALRKPGSSFKIFDYTPAIENGVVTPATILSSEFIEIDGWVPKEWNEGYFGKLTVRDALIYSSNICAVKTGIRTGLDRVVYYAKKMGIRTPLEPYPSMTIGGFEVTPLDMAVAYGVLANMGERVDARGILKIVGRDGRVIYESSPNPIRVVSKEASYVMTDLFKSVTYYYFPEFRGLPLACKSGTAGDFTSGWFIGYTKDFVVSCYIGSDKELIGLEGVKNWGRRFAGEIWRNIFKDLIKIKKPSDWERPEKVIYNTYCSKTGLLKNSNCKSGRFDLFILNLNIPYCNYHREYKVYVCKNNDKLLAPKNASSDLKQLKIFYDPDDIPKNYCQIEEGFSVDIKIIIPQKIYEKNPIDIEIKTDFKIGDTIEIDINGEKTFITSPPLKFMWYPDKIGTYYISVYLWGKDGTLKGKSGIRVNVLKEIKNTYIQIEPQKPKAGDLILFKLIDPPEDSFSVTVVIDGIMKEILTEKPFIFKYRENKIGKHKIIFQVFDIYGEKLGSYEKDFYVY